jgi:hypothetical protein
MDHGGGDNLTGSLPRGTPTRVSQTPTKAESQPIGGSTQASDSWQAPHKQSRIWQNAIQRYYEELEKGGYKGKAIDRDIWNVKDPVELLDQIQSFPSSKPWMDDLRKLLLSLSDFAAVTALALGMNGRVAAVIWGSIRLLLNVGHYALNPLVPSFCLIWTARSACLPKSRPHAEGSRNNPS